MFVVRPFVRLGDPHIHGGAVVKVDQTRYDVDAIKVACLGDMVICPIPGHGMCKIVQCQDSAFIDGKPAAVLGSLTACGAALIPTQFYAGLAPLTPPRALAEFGDHEDLLQPSHETDLQAMDLLLDFKRSPAQSPPEFAARISHFASEGAAYGYDDKYTQRELVRNAVRTREGSRPPPKVWGRFTETAYLKDEYTLGKPDSEGALRTWLVDPDYIEQCGDNPEKICAMLGLDYNPKNDYSLALVDAELMQQASPGAKTFTPTYEAVCEFCQSDLRKHFSEPELLPEVLTPGFSRVYEQFEDKLPDFSTLDSDQMSTLAEELCADEKTIHQLCARWHVWKQVGANRHYTGNGLTKLSRDDEPIRYGAGESYLYDRTPPSIGQYRCAGTDQFIVLPLPKEATS